MSVLSEYNERPKILIVARDIYPPFRVDIIELFSEHLAREYDLTWVMRTDRAEPRHVARNASECFVVIGVGDGRGKPIRRIFALAKVHTRMLATILRGGFDIVQCRDVLAISPLYALAARWAGTGLCYWMSFPMDESYIARGHQHLARGGISGRLGGWARIAFGRFSRLMLYRFTLPMADVVFVQSDQMKCDVAAEGIAANKIQAVPMGVSTDKYGDVGGVLPDAVYGTQRVVLYVGTLDAARRMEVPGRGVAQVLKAHPDVVFSVIGRATAAERARLIAPAVELGVAGRVVFHEHMPLADVFRHIRRADVCLAPYPETPRMMASATPTKLVEYLFLGARVVANRHPDQQYVIEQAGSGVLTDFDADSFAAGLEIALTAARRGEPLGGSGQDAPQWIRENRSYSALAAGVSTVYAALLARKGRRRHP